MRIDEYYTIPLEVGPRGASLARLRSMEWTNAPLAADYWLTPQVIPNQFMRGLLPNITVYYWTEGDSLIFVYHQWFDVSNSADTDDWVAQAASRRKDIQDRCVNGIALEPVATLVEYFGAKNALSRAANSHSTYAAPALILTLDHPIDDYDSPYGLSTIKSISTLLGALPRRGEDMLDLYLGGQRPLVPVPEVSPDALILVRGWNVVGAAWGDSLESRAKKAGSVAGAIVRSQGELHAAWSSCITADIYLEELIHNLKFNARARSRRRVNLEEYLKLLHTARHGRNALSSFGSKEEQGIHDALAKSLRLKSHVESLSEGIGTLERVMDQLDRRRITSGQNWITRVLVAFTGISASSGVLALTDWSLLQGIILMASISGGGLIIAWLLTLSRPGNLEVEVAIWGQDRSRRPQVSSDDDDQA